MIAISDNMYMQSEQNVNSSFIATNTGSITLNPQDGHVAITGCLSTTVTVCPSDKRFKKEIVPIEGAMPIITNLLSVYFKYNTSEFPNKKFPVQRQIGLVAQDVEKELPEIVFTDENGYKSIDYAKLTVLLIKGIQEQQKMMEQQNERLIKIEEQLSKM